MDGGRGFQGRSARACVHAGHVCAQGQCVQAMSRSRAPLSPLPPRMPTMSGRLDSFLADVLEHVEDEHVLRLLLCGMHVLLEVVLHGLQLQEYLQPPPLVKYG